ncbi:MAG TPA: hypothetical protein VER83_05270, partial [Candidatus Nanopelagicales bacterium]|nr:hypothetical protein [Candidatus Nanopelagicales bacterium]
DPERGPGLGCFWFQVIVLGFFFVLIPIGLNLNWPFELLAILLFVVLGLLLLTGQTVIFLLRLVAADRRAQGRRRPLASPTKTVGELEDEHRVAHAVGSGRPAAAPAAADSADGDATVAAEATRAPAPATEGEAAVPGDPPGGGEGKMAAPTHESSPDGHGLGPAADVPVADPAAAPRHDAGPGELPEEPDPGVRQ